MCIYYLYNWKKLPLSAGIWFQLLAHIPRGVGHKCQMQDIRLLLVDASYF